MVTGTVTASDDIVAVAGSCRVSEFLALRASTDRHEVVGMKVLISAVDSVSSHDDSVSCGLDFPNH